MKDSRLRRQTQPCNATNVSGTHVLTSVPECISLIPVIWLHGTASRPYFPKIGHPGSPDPRNESYDPLGLAPWCSVAPLKMLAFLYRHVSCNSDRTPPDGASQGCECGAVRSVVQKRCVPRGGGITWYSDSLAS
jgi:hypothetical protein